MHLFAFILFKILFIALFITVIVLFTRKRGFRRYGTPDPMTTLENRFVNGEINSDEYEMMREVLKMSRRK